MHACMSAARCYRQVCVHKALCAAAQSSIEQHTHLPAPSTGTERNETSRKPSDSRLDTSGIPPCSRYVDWCTHCSQLGWYEYTYEPIGRHRSLNSHSSQTCECTRGSIVSTPDRVRGACGCKGPEEVVGPRARFTSRAIRADSAMPARVPGTKRCTYGGSPSRTHFFRRTDELYPCRTTALGAVAAVEPPRRTAQPHVSRTAACIPLCGHFYHAFPCI